MAKEARALHPTARTVGVVGFIDHAKRCVLTTRSAGFENAFVPREAALPTVYDRQSAQAWTRDRETYLVHDMAAQMASLRAELIARKYPNG